MMIHCKVFLDIEKNIFQKTKSSSIWIDEWIKRSRIFNMEPTIYV